MSVSKAGLRRWPRLVLTFGLLAVLTLALSGSASAGHNPDDLSGIDAGASDLGDDVLSSEGAGQSATGTPVDLAGDSASATESPINIDLTDPTISSSRSVAPNANGWNNTDVTVSFSCGDDLSAVDTCSADSTLTGEGAGQTVTGTAVGLAGNSASTIVGPINIDKTAPECTCLETNNPSGKNVPKAGKNPKSGQNPDGFYVLNVSDGLSGATEVGLLDTGSDFVTGPYGDGTKIKLTQAPGATPGVKPGSGDIDVKVKLNGDGLATATDQAGNTTTVSCNVPPSPK